MQLDEITKELKRGQRGGKRNSWREEKGGNEM